MVVQRTRHPTTVRPSRLGPFALAITVLVVAVLVITLAANYWTHMHTQKVTPTPTTASSNTKGEKTSTSNQPTNGTTTQPNDGKETNSTPGTLLVPTGNFVSTHHLRSSDSLTSTCTTTPGATCQVTFTKDGVVKSLPALTTDAGGSAYWNNWQPNDYGLGVGTWTIQAIAKLGTQSATASDALSLEVQP